MQDQSHPLHTPEAEPAVLPSPQVSCSMQFLFYTILESLPSPPTSCFVFKEDASALQIPAPPRPAARSRRYTITPGHLKWDHFNLTYK